MIDIHSHILPETDDGAVNLEESLAMGRQEAEGGTTVVFATSHIYNATELKRGYEYVEKVAELQSQFDKEGVAIKLATGAEVFPMMEIMEAVNAGVPITLGDKKKHILLDLPLGQWPMTLSGLSFELLAAGITPILAHPERTMPVQGSLDILKPLLERGVLCQVNAGSLLGKYGPQAQKRGHQLLALQWAQFVATDMHHPSSNGASLKRAKDTLSELPPRYVEEITLKNPERVLNGAYVPTVEYDRLDAKPEKKGLIGRLFGRK